MVLSILYFNQLLKPVGNQLNAATVLTGLKMEVKLAGKLTVVYDALKHKNNHFICHA